MIALFFNVLNFYMKIFVIDKKKNIFFQIKGCVGEGIEFSFE